VASGIFPPFLPLQSGFGGLTIRHQSLRFNSEIPDWRSIMTSQMPRVPPANRSKKGPGADPETSKDTSLKHPEPQNIDEQGDTANIKQNTTNEGYFRGRRVK
jgi:hypothetical protein